MSAVRNIDQMDFQGAGSNQACTPFGPPDDPEPIFNPDASSDQAATLASEPDPRSDLSLGALCTRNSVDDWSPAALSKVDHSFSSSPLILNHQSSASSNAAYQVSKVLPLEPQSDGHLDVLSYAAFPATAQSLRCTRCWTLKQKVCHYPFDLMTI